jgi:hypothetical protein
MAMARRVTARWDTMTTTMATGDDKDDDDDGDGAAGYEVDDDGANELANKQTNKRTNKQTNKRTNKQTNEQTNVRAGCLGNNQPCGRMYFRRRGDGVISTTMTMSNMTRTSRDKDKENN